MNGNVDDDDDDDDMMVVWGRGFGGRGRRGVDGLSGNEKQQTETEM